MITLITTHVITECKIESTLAHRMQIVAPFMVEYQ